MYERPCREVRVAPPVAFRDMRGKVSAYVREAAKIHGVEPDQVFAYNRGKAYQARLRVIHALYDDGWHVSRIGRAVGRDHSTICYNLGLLDK